MLVQDVDLKRQLPVRKNNFIIRKIIIIKNRYSKTKKEYIDNGLVKFEHHAFPLDLAALNAEVIIRCNESTTLNGQKIRFELLTEMYKKQKVWAVGSEINKINKLIKKVGLDFGLTENKMDECLKNNEAEDEILNQRIEAQKNYKISSTPTIFINEKKYEGEHDFKSLKKNLSLSQ